MSETRAVAQRVFRCRARKEKRPHVAQSWADLAEKYVMLGGCDDGQTIKEIVKRRSEL